MRKLNGITINGEYLGNSVVINGMFRAICTISPVMMRDFIYIINKIDFLDEAVKIRNFNCGFDSINIEFENKTLKGIASLYFKLMEGEPVLTDCKLKIGDEEYSTAGQDKISIPQADKVSLSQSSVSNDSLERKQRINEIKERKLEKLKQLAELKKQKANERRPNPQRMDRPNAKRDETRQEELSPEALKKKNLVMIRQHKKICNLIYMHLMMLKMVLLKILNRIIYLMKL